MAKRQEAAGYRRTPQDEDWYEIKSWHGETLYQCRVCAYNTMDAQALLEHATAHATVHGARSERAETETTEES